MRRLHLPFGAGSVLWTPDRGEAKIFANQIFATQLIAEHRRRGRLYDKYDLGSGLITNVGVTALANDWAWAAPSAAAVNTLKLSNFHAVGTGVTVAAASDIALQSPVAPTLTSAQAGTQSLVSAANLQKYQTLSPVFSFGTTTNVSEWGLFTATTLSAATGSPFTATTANGGTVTGTPYTPSSSTAQGLQQQIVVAGTVYGLILSNSSSVITIPAWYKVADGTAGSTPGATSAFTLQPVMWDHRVFTALPLVSGDTLQFTYTATLNSGG